MECKSILKHVTVHNTKIVHEDYNTIIRFLRNGSDTKITFTMLSTLNIHF